MRSSPFREDAGWAVGLGVASAAAAALLGLIVVFLVYESWQVLAHVGIRQLLFDDRWHPLDGAFGLVPMLAASASTALGAMLLATPLGVGSAVFAQYYAPDGIARWYRRVLVLMAGVPSVVYGFWGLTALVPWIGSYQPPGSSWLAAVVVLALMILPTVALTADAALAALPAAHRLAAAALGLSRATTILRVLLPAARFGVVAGALLATARALGETMAVLMVAGNVVQFPTSPFASVRSLTANVALEMAYATDIHRSALFLSGLVLVLFVIVLAATAAKLEGGVARG